MKILKFKFVIFRKIFLAKSLQPGARSLLHLLVRYRISHRGQQVANVRLRKEIKINMLK